MLNTMDARRSNELDWSFINNLKRELSALFMGKNQGKKSKRKRAEQVRQAREDGYTPRHAGGNTVFRKPGSKR